tara:strand:- start:320 stop:514 length:195 start_codon:yes stop_codon:yes gene_type:complete
MIKKKLEEIDPQNPKKFIISLLLVILPMPGSFGSCVNKLIIKKDEMEIKNVPKKIFVKNNLKPP